VNETRKFSTMNFAYLCVSKGMKFYSGKESHMTDQRAYTKMRVNLTLGQNTHRFRRISRKKLSWNRALVVLRAGKGKGKDKDKVNPIRVHEGPHFFFTLCARWWRVVNPTPWPFYPRERPGTHCMGGWVGRRNNLEGCGKFRPHRDSIPRPSSP
jgi:hypothetical protein